jgi:hypothetical protein
MKEFSNIISVYPVADLTTESPRPWETDIAGTHNFQADDFILDPLPTQTDAGTIFDASKDLTIETPPAAELERFSYPVKSIVVLRDTDGTKYTIGSQLLPATIILQKGIQKTRLYMVAKLLQSPF